jgi:hypothetical protein
MVFEPTRPGSIDPGLANTAYDPSTNPEMRGPEQADTASRVEMKMHPWLEILLPQGDVQHRIPPALAAF